MKPSLSIFSLLTIVVLLSLAPVIFAETQIPGGNVSGIWTADDSPYLIEGEIVIFAGDSLFIQPGVSVIFQGHYKLIVQGGLEAVGTEQDSILFSAADTSLGWHGIRFIFTTRSCKLTYCNIEYGRASGAIPDNCGGGIFIQGSAVAISQCAIRQNQSLIDGGFGAGIYCKESSGVRISDCVISQNTAGPSGGGIQCSYSPVTITRTVIEDNIAAIKGAGIFLYGSNAVIDSCTVKRNGRNGISCEGFSAPSITSTTIAENMFTGITLEDSADAMISDCSISDQSAPGFEFRGGGIFCGSSSPQISGCTISRNIAWFGGGICSSGQTSRPVVQNSTISDNNATAGSGGGLYCADSALVTIGYCNMNGNTAANEGGGIATGGSGLSGEYTIDHCLIHNNTAGTTGGGIHGRGAALNCTVTQNVAGLDGGGFYTTSGPTSLNNTIVEGNQGNGGVYLSDSSGISVGYSDFHNNQAGDFLGNLPSNLGLIDRVNHNSDSCDVYSNIFQNPLFSGLPGDSAFYLSANSPCIDAGNPASPLDPDGTLADIGRFSYFQIFNPGISVNPASYNFGPVVIGTQGAFPLTVHSTGTASLHLISINCNDPVFSTNFDAVDSLLQPGDSLIVEVFFEPTEIRTYQALMQITSNCDPIDVTLNGTGARNVIITLTPLNPPIQVPSHGGTFQYNLNVHNNQTTPVNMDIWTVMKQLPDGPWTGPYFNVNRTLGGGANPTRLRNQTIAASLEAGTYLYEGRVGDYPDVIWSSSTFTFTKLSTGDGEQIDDFGNYGEDFPDESLITTVKQIPEQYSLNQNYPNPFNPLTSIRFNLPQAGLVKLTVFDVMGREVAQLVNGLHDAGSHSVTFDASGLASGIYLYKLEVGEYSEVQKMVLMK